MYDCHSVFTLYCRLFSQTKALNMTQPSNSNSTFSNIDQLLNDESFCRAIDALSQAPRKSMSDFVETLLLLLLFAGNVSQVSSSSSPSVNTPDPLNTAFIEVMTIYLL
jgi:hypothetical protein